MIQFIASSETLPDLNQYVNLDIYDKMTDTTYRPLFKFTSQATNFSYTSIPLSTDYSNKERFVRIGFIPLVGLSEFTAFGFIGFGTTDLPYGLYNVEIYQNIDNSNMNPDNAVKKIWSGLLNAVAYKNNLAVEYTEYADNDSENESIYITAVANN